MRTRLFHLAWFSPLTFVVFGLSCDSSSPFFLGGNQLDEPNLEKWVTAVRTSGMNTVSVTAHLFQGKWNRPKLQTDLAKDSATVAEIRLARKHGLHVVVIPRVHLDPNFAENRFLWHGMILPKSDADVRAWFETYTAILKKWAGIAEKYDVDVFAVGNELNMLSSTLPVATVPGLLEYYSNTEKLQQARDELLRFRTQVDSTHLWEEDGKYHTTLDDYVFAEHAARSAWARQIAFDADSLNLEKINTRRRLLRRQWQHLITEIREIYRGKLTYAANFDNYADVAFWPLLDIVGINAYFPLRHNLAPKSPDSLQAEMKTSWANIFREIDLFRESYKISGHPILFTEIGYTYRKNSTITPWTGGHFSVITDDSAATLLVRRKQATDLQERAFAIRALYATHQVYTGDLLAGLLYWHFSTTQRPSDGQPFLLHIGEGFRDPLLAELLRFSVP